MKAVDELELLKKQWQKQEQMFPKLTHQDIYKMLLKKSSSIVKWIFFISVAEIVFWTLLTLLIPDSSYKINAALGLNTAMIVVSIVNYCVFGIFIFMFYKNYKRIKITDSIKELMRNILMTRKTVTYFVIYNVTATSLILLAVNIFYYFQQDQLYQLMIHDFAFYKSISQQEFVSIFFISQIIVGVIFIGIILLFYRIIYGILLRTLSRNYKKLKEME